MWVHGSILQRSAQRLGIETPSPSTDLDECCYRGDSGYVKGSTITNGCCGIVGDQAQCVAKLLADKQPRPA